jgi:hypothetical protein
MFKFNYLTPSRKVVCECRHKNGPTYERMNHKFNLFAITYQVAAFKIQEKEKTIEHKSNYILLLNSYTARQKSLNVATPYTPAC